MYFLVNNKVCERDLILSDQRAAPPVFLLNNKVGRCMHLLVCWCTCVLVPVVRASQSRASVVRGSFLFCVPVLAPVRASPVPSVVRGSFVVKFY